MVMDLTEPIPVIAPPPGRELRLAVFVGVSGIVALLVAVVALLWTVTEVSKPTSQAVTIPADIASKPAAAAPAGVLAPEPAAAPAPAANAEILRNPTMAAIAPTAPSPVADPAWVSDGTVPTVAWPDVDVANVDWNAVGSTLGLQNLDWAGLLWANTGADATTSAVIGAASSLGNTAVSLVGNGAWDLILANSGWGGGSTSVPSVSLPQPGEVAAALTALAVPSAVIPEVGLPSLPAPPEIGLPQLPGIGIGLPGTPIGIGLPGF